MKFHQSTFRPTLKETANGQWYVLLELYEKVGIPEIDSGNRQVAIVLPSDASEADARKLQDSLHIKGAKVAYIE